MNRTTRSLNAFVVFAALTGGAGCATTAGGGGHRDVHGQATLAGGGRDARLLVVGPAVLMHIDLDEREDLTLYTVERVRGTDADCVAGSGARAVRLHGGDSNRLDLTVADGE